MKVYKDNEHSLSLMPFSWQGKGHLMLTIGLYTSLDPQGGQGRLRTEQDFWKEIPEVFAALNLPPVIDYGLPKTAGEVFVAGFCKSPNKEKVEAQNVRFEVGQVKRSFTVFGERERLPGGGYTKPIPFSALPLTWDRAFGGPHSEKNPLGKGLDEDNKLGKFLPQVEDPQNLFLSDTDRPDPQCPLPIPIENPKRRKLSGTYDQAWLDNRWPAYPDDCQPEFFQSAQKAQRLPNTQNKDAFFDGTESIEMHGMHHDYPLIKGKLPPVRLRAFVKTCDEFVPFSPNQLYKTQTGQDEQAEKETRKLPYSKDLDAPGLFHELDLHLDTIWLFPDILGVYTLYRALLPVSDDELDDILRVLIVSENPKEAPQSLEYYRDEMQKRAYPSVEIDLSPFIEAQGKISKSVKVARDYPKVFERVKKNFLGQSPVMPLSLGDMAFSSKKVLQQGHKTLDILEGQLAEQKNLFSHVINFNKFNLQPLRAMLHAQEASLDKVFAEIDKDFMEVTKQVRNAFASAQKDIQGHLQPSPYASPTEIEVKAELNKASLEKFALLDNFLPEEFLAQPESINPWHDKGFPLVIAARRRLNRDSTVLTYLQGLGFEEQSLHHAWLGLIHEDIKTYAPEWGIQTALHSTVEAHTLPKGLVVPHFTGPALSSLSVYPLHDDGELQLRGLGTEATSIVFAPGSKSVPLSLPASHSGGPVLVAPEALSALFAEQEVGDFCHIVAAKNPEELAAVEDLPSIETPQDSEEDSAQKTTEASPLAILLPPLPEGEKLFVPWKEAYPLAIPVYLPKDCPHVLALAALGKRLRPLILEKLPEKLAKIHDFDFPLPPKDKPMSSFSLNLPLPTEKELTEGITKLMDDIKGHFPDTKSLALEALGSHKKRVVDKLHEQKMPPHIIAQAEDIFSQAEAKASTATVEKALAEGPTDLTAAMEQTQKSLEAMRKEIKDIDIPEENKAFFFKELDIAEEKLNSAQADFAPLVQIEKEGKAKLENFKKGILPGEVQAAFDEQGMDPNTLKLLSREEVIDILNKNKDLSRRNLQGLDLSELDFSGADLSHALCGKASFKKSCMDNVNFTFTLANEADFTECSFHNALFKQTVLQKAVLTKSDFSLAQIELSSFEDCEAEGAIFEKADIKLCTFAKSRLSKASFSESLLHLTAFNEVEAQEANFTKIRAFKCLFQSTNFDKASFDEAVVNECLFQAVKGKGLSFIGAECKKMYADADSDLSYANFTAANLEEASLRMSRLMHANFAHAKLDNAMIAHCDLSFAYLSGLQARQCRFTKCDLTRADLSGSNLMYGELKKCRLSGANLSHCNLFAANLLQIVIDKGTDFSQANLKKTALANKEDILLNRDF